MKFRYRIFDISISIIIAFITLPIQIGLAIILFFELKENPILIQKRGITFTNGRVRILKFKTIKSSLLKRENVEDSCSSFLNHSQKYSITKFCNWIRKTGLDELPQIYNVLLGSMSLVGPRPLILEDLEMLLFKFTEYYKLRNQLSVKPGITGVWQLFGNRSLGAYNLIELDYFYEKNLSINLNLKILFNTFLVMLFQKHTRSILQKLDLFDKLFSLTILSANSNFNFGKITIEDANNKIRSYKINLPANWWYVCDSYEKSVRSEMEPILIDIDEKEKILLKI